eukprot:2308768-Pyramimonas_sp.AAC.1
MYARRGADLFRSDLADRLVIIGCHEIARQVARVSARQEAMIADAGVFDHVSSDWLREVDLGSFEVPPGVLEEGVGDGGAGASSVVGGGGATASGVAQDADEVSPSPVRPPPGEEAWARLRPWRARGHSCIEAPVTSAVGAPLGPVVFCTTCGSIGRPGTAWGRSALVSDCLGSRPPGRERQLVRILQRQAPVPQGTP